MKLTPISGEGLPPGVNQAGNDRETPRSWPHHGRGSFFLAQRALGQIHSKSLRRGVEKGKSKMAKFIGPPQKKKKAAGGQRYGGFDIDHARNELTLCLTNNRNFSVQKGENFAEHLTDVRGSCRSIRPRRGTSKARGRGFRPGFLKVLKCNIEISLLTPHQSVDCQRGGGGRVETNHAKQVGANALWGSEEPKAGREEEKKGCQPRSRRKKEKKKEGSTF